MSKGTPFDLDNNEDVPDLYKLLDVPRAAKEDELRKAYRKRALRTHPDKWVHLDPKSDEAKAKTLEFQQVGFAYSILKDPKRRDIYDKTGRVDDILDVVEEGKDWDAYFRQLWSGVVDASTIEQFAKTYKGSDEEKADILAAYNIHKGDIDLIFTEVMLAEVDDEPRFVEVIETAIKEKSLKRTKTYTRSKKSAAKRKRKADEEASEAETLRKELGLDDQLRKIKRDQKKNASGKRKHESEDVSDDGALKALVRQRTSNRMGAIIANIEEKYASQQPTKKKGKNNRSKKPTATAFTEPSEEEFQALQAKMFGKK